jgi:hypothetical protein
MARHEFEFRYLADLGSEPLDDAEAKRRIRAFAEALGPEGRANGNASEMVAAVTTEGDEDAARAEAHRVSQGALDAAGLYGYFRTAQVDP